MLVYNNYSYYDLKSSVKSKNYTHNGIYMGKIFFIECSFSKEDDKGYLCFFVNVIHSDFNILKNKEYQGNLDLENLHELPIIDFVEFANNDKIETLFDGEYWVKFSDIINDKIHIYLTIKNEDCYLKLETDLELRVDK